MDAALILCSQLKNFQMKKISGVEMYKKILWTTNRVAKLPPIIVEMLILYT